MPCARRELGHPRQVAVERVAVDHQRGVASRSRAAAADQRAMQS